MQTRKQDLNCVGRTTYNNGQLRHFCVLTPKCVSLD